MNRNLISIAVAAAFLVSHPARRYGDEKPVADGGEAKPPAFDPAAARTALVEYGHAEESVKGMKDEDVQKLHGTVSKAEQKRIDAALAKTKGEGDVQVKAMQEKWTKGELKLELPKDSKLAQTDVDEVAAIARTRGLSTEQATELLAQRNAAATAFETRAVETMKVERGKWVESIKTDKELGGDNLAETQRLSMLAVERFATPALREKLRETGFGDHPEIVRMWVSIGKAMSEDKPGVGGGLGKGGGGEKSIAEKLYDNTPA